MRLTSAGFLILVATLPSVVLAEDADDATGGAFAKIDVVDRPDTSAAASPYVPNRAPLEPAPLIKLPLGSVRPEGWVKRQLSLMVDGMEGRLTELSEFVTSNSGWLGDKEERGWEEAGYWFRGFYDLAFLTQDKRLLEESEKWIETILASQEKDGYFGASFNKRVIGKAEQALPDLWPHMVMIDAFVHHHEATGDPRVIELLSRFFDFCAKIPDGEFLPQMSWDRYEEYKETFGDWRPRIQMKRAGDMVPHILWLYNRTGGKGLLDLAVRFYQHTQPAMNQWLDNHNVHFAQRWRYPAQMYPITGRKVYLERSEYWYEQFMITWGQSPRGIFAADERIRMGKVDPRQAIETCGITEFAKSFYILGRITGDPKYADRCEDIIFNHFPVTQTPDHKGLHYLTAANQPQLDGGSDHDYKNSGQQLVYSPHRHRCCQHNVTMGWPWYAQNLWQASLDGGLVAWLYGPSSVTARVGARGDEVTIRSQTDYPFSGTVNLSVSGKNRVSFPLYLRVPRWCRSMNVTVNGESQRLEEQAGRLARIRREWSDGDEVIVEMGMDVSLTQWPRNGSVTVDRGPLSYSVRIAEDWKLYPDQKVADRLGWDLKTWPQWQVFPDPNTPWNYGLVVDLEQPRGAFEVIEKGLRSDQPWTVDEAPIIIKARAKRIPDWKLVNNTVDSLREGPIRSDEPVETIEMIPLGCARLRMSCLPVIGDGPEARYWKDVPVPDAFQRLTR